MMKTIHHKDAINRRLYNNQSFVETAIYRVSCLNTKRIGTHFVFTMHRDTIALQGIATFSVFQRKGKRGGSQSVVEYFAAKRMVNLS